MKKRHRAQTQRNRGGADSHGTERRLALRREVLRDLTPRDLARVAGAGTKSNLVTRCQSGSDNVLLTAECATTAC